MEKCLQKIQYAIYTHKHRRTVIVNSILKWYANSRAIKYIEINDAILLLGFWLKEFIGNAALFTNSHKSNSSSSNNRGKKWQINKTLIHFALRIILNTRNIAIDFENDIRYNERELWKKMYMLYCVYERCCCVFCSARMEFDRFRSKQFSI